MRDTVSTSWRRRSDQAQKHGDSRSTSGGQALPLLELSLLYMSGYEVARLLRERAQSRDL